MRRTILATLVSVPLWVQFAHGHGTQAVPGAPAPVSLLPERPVERVLAGEQEHGYQITLEEGRQALVVIEQRGIDVVEPISAYGLYIVGDSENVSKLKSLPFVTWIGP